MLESKHVIGLFLLMLLFSGVFFSLGYVMGRNQYDGQVRAATNGGKPDPVVMAKPDAATKKNAAQPAAMPDADPATSDPSSDWAFSGTGKPARTEPRLEPAPKASAPVAPPKPLNAKAKVPVPAVAEKNSSRNSMNGPLIPSGALVLQVAALKSQNEALNIASSLQKKHFLAYVQPPQRDKYFRVQVGPFRDQKSADAAKKGLESEGFKAFYVKH